MESGRGDSAHQSMYTKMQYIIDFMQYICYNAVADARDMLPRKQAGPIMEADSQKAI
jgi:hypothetical protein